MIVNGQKEIESNEHITAVFIDGEWRSSGDYGLDLNKSIEIGDGLLIYVQEDGEINF